MTAACIRNFHRAIPLLVIWFLVVAYLIYGYIYNRYEEEFDSFCVPLQTVVSSNMYWIKWHVVCWIYYIICYTFWFTFLLGSLITYACIYTNYTYNNYLFKQSIHNSLFLPKPCQFVIDFCN